MNNFVGTMLEPCHSHLKNVFLYFANVHVWCSDINAWIVKSSVWRSNATIESKLELSAKVGKIGMSEFPRYKY